jgi:nitrous oxidase accessory protein NosD
MELLLLSIILLETESGRGIWCENQAGVEFSNNTIASTNGNGDYGIHVSNLSAPIIKNNIIDNFQNGIYADNTIANYAIQYNDTWSISGTEYSGGALTTTNW